MAIGFIDQLAFNTSIPLISAFFIGIATAIAPCAFATNVAAISYLAHHMNRPGKALRAGLFFTFGRMLTYLAIGMVMILTGQVLGGLARGMQSYGNLLMGPLLIVMGLVFSGVFSINFSTGSSLVSYASNKFSNRGNLGAFVMGAVFGLAFCPYSGMLFFGLLIPLSLESTYGVFLPALFGVGVSLPVLAFVFLLYFSASRARSFGQAVNKSWPIIGRSIGIVMIIIGCYYVTPYITDRYAISHAFAIMSIFLLSIVGLILVRSVSTQRYACTGSSIDNSEDLDSDRRCHDNGHNGIGESGIPRYLKKQ